MKSSIGVGDKEKTIDLIYVAVANVYDSKAAADILHGNKKSMAR